MSRLPREVLALDLLDDVFGDALEDVGENASGADPAVPAAPDVKRLRGAVESATGDADAAVPQVLGLKVLGTLIISSLQILLMMQVVE